MTHRKRVAVLALGVLLCSCISRDMSRTRFRRTAFVPMPAPGSLSQPVHGRVEVLGAASIGVTDPNDDPASGDPALRAATVEFDARARVVILPYLTLGAQGVFAHSSMSRATARGTPRMPGEQLYGGGPNVSLHYRRHFGHKRASWGIGGGLALSYVSVPYAVWERDDGRTSEDYGYSSPTSPAYHLVRSGREERWLYMASFGGGVAFNPSFEIFLQGSVRNALTNVGFDDAPAAGSTLGDVLGFVYTAGVAFHAPGGLLIRAQYGVAIGYSQLHFYGVGPVLQLELGMELGEPPAGRD